MKRITHARHHQVTCPKHTARDIAIQTTTNLWTTGYQAHVRVAHWQKGVGIDLDMGRSMLNGQGNGAHPRKVYLEEVMATARTRSLLPCAFPLPREPTRRACPLLPR